MTPTSILFELLEIAPAPRERSRDRSRRRGRRDRRSRRDRYRSLSPSFVDETLKALSAYMSLAQQGQKPQKSKRKRRDSPPTKESRHSRSRSHSCSGSQSESSEGFTAVLCMTLTLGGQTRGQTHTNEAACYNEPTWWVGLGI